LQLYLKNLVFKHLDERSILLYFCFSALMIDQKGKTQSIESLSTSRHVDIDTLAVELGIDEKKLMRKIDWHVLPVLCGFYLLQSIDKVKSLKLLTT
jgi:hypothetical protein